MNVAQAPWLSSEAMELVASRFRVLGEGSRLRLLAALKGGEHTVSELVAMTGLTQANVSRHLNLLAEAGILNRRKEGLNVYYFVIEPAVFQLCERVCGQLQRKFDAGSHALVTSPEVNPATETDKAGKEPEVKAARHPRKASGKVFASEDDTATADFAVPAGGESGFAVTFD